MMLEKLFGFDRKVTSVRTEVIAGITTFLTMAYILAINPNVLSATGMDKGALFTTTVVASAFATLLMAFYAKLPFSLAPGMGLSTFFAYTVCLTMGYTWQFALTAVLIEGIIFILLTVSNLREKIVNAIPETLKHAIGAGIGLFISFIGLQNARIIVNNDVTLLGLGDITSGPALLGIIGLVLTAVLLVRKVKGALLLGILLTTLIGIPMGITRFEGVFSAPPSIEPIFCQFEWKQIFTKEMLIVVFTFLFVDMFDTIGTLVGVITKAGMVDKDGKIPCLKQAFLVGSHAGHQYHRYLDREYFGRRRRRSERSDGFRHGGLFPVGLVPGSVFPGCARCRYGSGTDSGGSDDDGGCAENRLYRLFRSYPGFHLHPVYAVGLQHFGRYRIGNDRLCAD